MKPKYFLLSLVGVALLGGCDKQTKINTEKIAALSEKLVVVQQNQSAQLSLMQTQLTALVPMLDRVNSYYFEKSHDNAIFFHTNNLFLMLTVGKRIESQLREADVARQTEHDLAYSYHTNQLRTMFLCVAQLEETLATQESRLTNQMNAEIGRASADLLKGIQSQAPDKAEIARRMELAADVAQLKRDIEQIKVRLGITNLPAATP